MPSHASRFSSLLFILTAVCACDQVENPAEAGDRGATMPGPLYATSKIDVCHMNGQNELVLISVSDNAFPTHVEHGDQAAGNGALDEHCQPVVPGDPDADGDGIPDADDSCPNGTTGWTYYPGTPEDLDDDGCHDASEDPELVKYHGGIVSRDETWVRGVEHHITSDLYVGDEATHPVVTIEDGSVVVADVGVDLYIGHHAPGGLLAVGSTSLGILFTSPSATPLPGDWGGIYFGAHNLSESHLSAVTVEYAGGNGSGAIVCYATSLTMSDSVIRDSSENGVYVMGGSSLTITDSVIRDSSGDGVYLVGGSSLTISDSSIWGSDGYGIYLASGSSATITNVDLSGNAYGDVYP